jgi:hypothetical protein
VSYANRLADTSMRFLAGLIQAGTTYSYELVETILPGAAPATAEVPPEFDPADWGDWFKRLTDYATTENAGVTGMLRSVMEKVATGELAPAGVEELSVVFHEQRLPGSVSKLVELYFDLLTGLDDIHAAYGEEYLQAVVGPASRGHNTTLVSLDLTAPVGETALVRLAVANTAAEPAAVRCVVTDVRRADGIGPAFEPDASITPERIDLAPGRETTIALSIRLADRRYEPGALYVGTLHVLSPSDTLLEVPLRIRATAAPDQPDRSDKPDVRDGPDSKSAGDEPPVETAAEKVERVEN